MRYIFDLHSDILYDVVEKRIAGKTHVIRNFHLNKLTDHIGIIANYFFTGKSNREEFELMLEYLEKEIAECQEDYNIVLSKKDIKFNGKLNIIFGIEGLYPIENLSDIDRIYNAGIRVVSLTWNDDNKIGGGAKGTKRLTPFGEEVVKYLETKGIIIDLSHANEETFYDVIRISNKPKYISHSNCYSLYPHPRNIKDKQIETIINQKGIIGLTPTFFVGDKPRTINTYINHITYIGQSYGFDNVAIGNDFLDYLPKHQSEGIEGLTSSKEAHLIIETLLNHGLTINEVSKIGFKNSLRFFYENLK